MPTKWPFLRQLRDRDFACESGPAVSGRSKALEARTVSATKVVKSICPYCAVGCGQDIYVRDGKIINIEGDYDSPISRGCLCPKGSATFQLVTGSHREKRALYRRPYATSWELLPLETAMDMVAERVKATREATWDPDNRRTMGIAHLGGATLDNEENYLIKKLFTSLGIVQIENQARV
jgi:formate dehydrogenase major subunit